MNGEFQDYRSKVSILFQTPEEQDPLPSRNYQIAPVYSVPTELFKPNPPKDCLYSCSQTLKHHERNQKGRD
jgi:hypothetical protein